MPQMARRLVVLPAPFAPSSAVTPPSSTAKSSPCSTFVSRYQACSPIASSSDMFGLTEIGADHLRLVAHLFRRPIGDLHAELEGHHFVRDAHHEAHVMFDQQDRELEL